VRDASPSLLHSTFARDPVSVDEYLGRKFDVA
jgi:hypothetical protein